MKTVLITGASRGIGAECARMLAGEGYAVAVNYCRSKERALALVEEIARAGGTAAAFPGDVADSGDCARLVEETVSRFGGLDAVVCNAGVALEGLLTDVTDEEWRRLFAVNVDGVFYTIRAALPHFIHQKAGSIVTVSSMWGQVGGSCEAAYSAAKAAVIGLTKALAKEAGPSGVRVNCVAPGVIDTEMNRNLTREDLDALAEETPLERLGRARDAAGCVSFLLSEKASFLTGQVIAPNGGLVI